MKKGIIAMLGLSALLLNRHVRAELFGGLGGLSIMRWPR